MKRSTWLALRMLAVVLVVAALVAGAILLSLDRSSDAGNTATTNRAVNAKQAAKITENTAKLDRLLRCLSTAKHPLRCLDRIGGPKAPGGGTGRQGRAGLNVVGAKGDMGSRGRRGARGPAPTSAQLVDALAPLLPGLIEAFCAADACADAPPITDEQIREQLRILCGGSCKGDPGRDGIDAAPAAPGMDGVPGPAGPPGTFVLSVATCLPGEVAMDPDNDGNFTTCGPPSVP